jgi:threonyl-tRNA synthetase
MPDLTVSVRAADGSTQTRSVPAGSSAADLFTDRTVLVARIGDQLKDLSHLLQDGDEVEPVRADSDEGRAVLRHSAAHVLAQAVQAEFPGARLGIGPPITDGFYYDFDVERPFTPDDLAVLEKRMQQIIKSGQRFSRRVVTEPQARAELAAEPYKLELIGLKGGNHDPDVMEVGGTELTIYDNLDARSGERAWGDLCRGPHLPPTRMIPAV